MSEPITLANVLDANLGFEWHLVLLAAVLVAVWLLRRWEGHQVSKREAVLRVGLVVGAVVAGGMVGGDVGLIAGLAWDQVTANDWVSSALLFIPVGGLIGSVFRVGWQPG